MSKIRGEETKPEDSVRKFLFSKGFRYRKNDKRYRGKPDIVLPRHKTIIFVHGCFWHGHKNCRAAKLPVTNYEFWKNKISNNISRDEKTIAKLKSEGWNVIVLWQCEIKNERLKQGRFEYLIKEITDYSS